MGLNRRGFVRGLGALIPTVAAGTLLQPHRAEAAKKTLYFNRLGGGNGSSFSSPASIKDLDSLIRDVGPNGIVYGLAGLYQSSTLKIKHGGARVAFVKPDMTPGVGRIVGKRTFWSAPDNPETITDVSKWNDGTNFMEFYGGCDGLTLEGFQVERVLRAFYMKANLNKITIKRSGAYNVRQFLEHSSSVSVKQLKLTNIRVIGFSKQCIRMRSNSSGWTVNNFLLDSGRQDRDDFAKGISVNDTAHNLKINRGVIQNCHSTLGSYYNGDGISTENRTYDITISDVTSRGHADAGFDLKSNGGVTLRRCNAFSNKKNYRFWDSHYFMQDCVSGSVRKRGGGGNTGHVTTYSSVRTPTVRADGLMVVEKGSGTVFIHGAKGSRFDVTNYNLDYSSSATLERTESGGSGTLLLR